MTTNSHENKDCIKTFINTHLANEGGHHKKSVSFHRLEGEAKVGVSLEDVWRKLHEASAQESNIIQWLVEGRETFYAKFCSMQTVLVILNLWLQENSSW